MGTKTKEVLRFKVSDRMADTLRFIEHPISNRLLEMHEKGEKSELSYIDVCEGEQVSFITYKKAMEIDSGYKDMKKAYVVEEDMTVADIETPEDPVETVAGGDDVVEPIVFEAVDDEVMLQPRYYGEYRMWREKRSNMKPGRFVNKVLGDDFSRTDVEDFVNKYKAVMNQTAANLEFVDGEDIIHWYKSENYSQGNSVLQSSCMSRVPYMQLYANNPETCRMLVLKNPTDPTKIDARALVWKLESINGVQTDKYLMDRIYTTKDWQVNIYKEFAKENGYVTKEYNTYGMGRFIDPDDGETKDMQLIVKVRPMVDYEHYPFVDTLKNYNMDEGYITNDVKGLAGEFYPIGHTGGRRGSAYKMVRSRKNNTTGESFRLVHCKLTDDWLYPDQTVKVTNGGKAKVDKDAELVECKLNGHKFFKKRPIKKDGEWTGEFSEKDNVVWSDELDTYLFWTSARKVWKDKNRNEFVYLHKRNEVNPEKSDSKREKYRDLFVVVEGENIRRNTEGLYLKELCEYVDGKWALK